MYRWTIVSLVLANALLGQPTASGTPAAPHVAASPVRFDETHVLVQFRSEASTAARQAAHAAVNAVVVGRLDAIRADVVRLPQYLTPPEAVARYEQLSDVTHAGLNYYLDTPTSHRDRQGGPAQFAAPSSVSATDADAPNDPKFGDQWALHNDGWVDVYNDLAGHDAATAFGELEEEFDVDALEGWRMLKPSSARLPVRVAILDTGINRRNSDLQNVRVVACARVVPTEGRVEEGPDKCHDDTGDGTAIAGIIAADSDNGIGITGIAPDVELVIGNFLRSDTLEQATMADYLAMLLWAKDTGADIVNIHVSTPTCLPDDLERDAIQELYESGTLIVAGAGIAAAVPFPQCTGLPNARRYPASYDEFVLSVGATNPRGEVWQDDLGPSGTVCNESVDILAPGEFVWSTTSGHTEDFHHWRGATPSTAYVSGVAALLMSQEGLAHHEVRDRLLATTTEVEEHPLRPGECAGLGQVNLAAALEAGPLAVTIDIKPGSADNPINTRGGGSVPVAVLTTADFDARTVDAASAAFGPSAARSTRDEVQDVDGDGDLDLMLHYDQRASGISSGDSQACLTGSTTTGRSIRGCDRVTAR